ncbi:MAG: ABC transporter permease [Clostridiaceae bacterium]|nr:ABC transporter permease [Clostridiaceae bacterium]
MIIEKEVEDLKSDEQRSTSFRDDAIRRFKKNPTAIFGLVIVIFFFFIAVFGQYITPHNPFQHNISNAHQPPGGEHLLGTDFFGRDVLSRIIIGARISLLVGVTVVTIRAAIGIPYGLIAGYYGGRVEAVMMRVVDAFISFPGIILAMAIMAVRGQGIENVILALTVSGWPMFARLVRGESMALKEREYVQAARALGYNDGKVMFQHILPNCLATIIVYATMGIATPILAEAGLSFLGLGATPDQATWGFQMSLERQYMRTAWWSVTFPGLAVMVVVLGFNLLGDGLRDVLDPRMKE